MRRFTVLLTCIALVGGVLAAEAGPAAAAGPSVTVGDVQVTEGDSGSVTVKVPVDLSVPAASDILVPYSIHASSDGTADAADARFKTGILKFAAGASSKTIAVVVLSDQTSEPDQHISISLGQPTGGAIIADGEGSVDIVDDDAGGVNPGMDASVGSASVEEADSGVHTVYLPVTLSRPATSTVKLVFTVGCSTASFVTDVKAPKTGAVTFLAGQRSKTISFRVNADTTPETTKAMIRDFTETTGNAVVTTDTSNTTIVDDDGTPVENDGTLYDCGHGLPGFARETVPTNHFDQGAVGAIEPISVGLDGSPATASSASTSWDGSATVFESGANNLVAGDTNGLSDIFVRDRRTNTTDRVSVKADGSEITPADMVSYGSWPGVTVGTHASISADGRYVVFQTPASLVPEDLNAAAQGMKSLDIYVRDRVANTTQLVSVGPDGHAAGGAIWFQPSISAHGRYVTWVVEDDQSSLTGFHGGTYEYHAFVRDRLFGSPLEVLDAPTFGDPVISADGSTVVLQNASNTSSPVLLAVNLETGAVDRVDVTSAGIAANERDLDLRLLNPSVSSNGRYVAFGSDAANLPSGGAFAGAGWAYVRDRTLGTTSSTGGMAQLFWPASVDDGPGHLALGGSANVLDLVSGTASVAGASSPGRLESTRALSGDGRFVVFHREIGSTGGVFVQRIS